MESSKWIFMVPDYKMPEKKWLYPHFFRNQSSNEKEREVIFGKARRYQ